MLIRKLCILLLLPASALAASGVPQPSASIPAAPQTAQEARTQRELAATIRREAGAKRSEAEDIRNHDYNACLSKILVNACRDDVRKEYIRRISVVRQMEVDANEIDRVAKARLVELDNSTRQAPTPTAKPTPAGAASAPRQAPRPGGKPGAVASGPAQSLPAATVSPEAQARADALRAQHANTVAKDREARAADAAARADKASEDRARYVRRQQEHAAKQAAKAEKQAPKNTPASANSAPATK